MLATRPGPKPRPTEDKTQGREVTLLPRHWRKLELIGRGNASLAIRKLIEDLERKGQQ